MTPQFGRRGTDTLATSEAFPKLAHLYLNDCGLTDHDAEGLLGPNWLQQLQYINLAQNPLTDVMIRQLRTYFGDKLATVSHERY